MRILLAVSGGIDSMYMAERALSDGVLFASWAKDPEFAVANCNFHLRGSESDGDTGFVRDWCNERHVALFVKDFDTLGYAKEHGVSVEMAARDLRYGWFASLCKDEGFDAVAVAHNADDNAETLILNLLRGCGTNGMRGMSKDSGEFPSRILRPLLETSRKEISDWMQQEGKIWREDSSNSETVFKRNKLRHLVLPVFAQINPSYLKTLSADMQRVSQVDDIARDYCTIAAAVCILEDGASVDLRKLRTFKHWEYLIYRFTQGRLNADGIFRLQEAIRSGRELGGKRFGPYKVLKSKLLLVEKSGKQEL